VASEFVILKVPAGYPAANETIDKSSGAPLELPGGGEAWITIYPSYRLRIEDEGAAEEEYVRFVADLSAIQDRLPALKRKLSLGLSGLGRA